MKFNLFLLSIIGLLLALNSCSLTRISEDKQICPIDYLLLRESDFPKGTIFDPIRSPIDEKPKESASRSSYYYESWIRESVIRYRSVQKAQEIFIEYQTSIFDPDEIYDTWKAPVNLEPGSISANLYETACGNVKNFGNRCIMLAQYEEYVIFFSVDISKNGVTQELFTDLALGIDSRLSSCIGK